VAEIVEHLPNKHEALNRNSTTAKKRKEKKKEVDHCNSNTQETEAGRLPVEGQPGL
jgi:hypothetical protein